MFSSDLNVHYSGGSGGFYFLHCLLMQKQHFCWFLPQVSPIPGQKLRLAESDYNNVKDISWLSYSDYLRLGNQGNKELASAELKWASNPEEVPGWFDHQLDAVYSHNWNIRQPTDWKTTEIWPVNQHTLQSNCADRKYKIFFTCNKVDEWVKWPGKKIWLYTDLRTQLRLAMYKKAWHYNKSAEKLFTRTKNIIKSAKMYRGDLVTKEAFDALEHAEHAVKLQDFVTQMLGEHSTQQQKAFTNQWLGYHSNNLRSRCKLG